MSGGSFTFPKLPRPKPLPAQVSGARARAARTRLPAPPADTSPPACRAQSPLLAKATVTDRSGDADDDMGAGPSKPKPVPAGGAPRRGKVPFEIGYSQVDWIQLTRTHPDLAGEDPNRRGPWGR